MPRLLGRAAFVRAGLASSSCLLGAVLMACSGGGGGGSGSSTGLTLTAGATATAPSGQTIHLHATTAVGTAAPTWTLSGPGSLDTSTGADIVYTPPASTPGNEAATATVTVTAGGSSQQAEIALHEIDGPGHHWDVSLAAGTAWQDVAFGNGVFVAVGGNGVIATSSDGSHWAHRDTPDHNNWESVAYSPTAGWVALAWGGQLVTSRDGSNWTSPSPLPHAGPSGGWNKVVFGNGVFVAASDEGSAESSDGRNWITGGTPLHWVSFGNGIFVGVAPDGSPMVSSDGIHWPALTASPKSTDTRVAFGNGLFVAANSTGLSTSVDGVQWTAATPAPGEVGGMTVTFAGGRFYLSGGSESSSDGRTWTALQHYQLLGAATNADGSVIVGIRQDLDAMSAPTSLASGASVDNLVLAAPGSYGDIQAADCNPGTCLAMIGWQTSLVSVDHVNWTAAALPREPRTQGLFYPSAVSHMDSFGTFLVAGTATYSDGTGTHAPLTFMTSPNGTDWLFQTPANAPEAQGDAALVHAPQGWLALAGGELDVSGDGVNWTKKTGGIESTIATIAYGNGHYVVVGQDGSARWSDDGATWTVASLPANAGSRFPFTGIVFANNQFVAVADKGRVAVSPDGATWTLQNTATKSDLYAIAASNNGEIIAVGDFGATESSADGVHWTLRATLTNRTLRTVSAFNGGFIVAGDDNFVQISSH